MHRDVGYARISSDDLRLGLGVARQTDDIRGVSERTGGKLIDIGEAGVLVDNDISASRYSKKARKRYTQLVDLIRAGAVDRAIVYRLDRLLRIPRELEDLIDLCEEQGFLVVNLHGSLDLTTAEGRKYARDRVADAAYESDLISERVKRANDAIAAKGGSLSRTRAFGYACNGRHHPDDCPEKGKADQDCDRHCEIPGCRHDGRSVVPSEANALRQAVAEVIAGESITGIARRWNAEGIRPVRGGQAGWQPTTVRVVLSGARQAGLVVHRGEIVGPGDWEAIIDRDSHERVKRVIDSRGHDQPRRRGEFTGLFKTEEGWSMKANTAGGRRDYRFLSRPGREGRQTSIAAKPLEDLVHGWLFDAADDGSIARRRAGRTRKPKLTPVAEDPSELERRLVELAEDEANDRISRAEWLVKRERLTERLRVAQAATQRDEEDEILAEVTPGLRDRWESLSNDRRRAILLAVFERIIVHPASKMGPVFDPDRVEPIWRE